jgi:hypothetical protein
MAYPDYSIVIVDRPNPALPLETITESNVFSEATEAKAYYLFCIAQDWRCFLFERPMPSGFRRNDAISIPTNVNQGV